MKTITREWLKTASLDLETIRHLLNDERLTGQVAFHAQQAVEKSLKAVLDENGLTVPKIHSLQKLLALCENLIDITVDEEFIIALDSLYIESRYPGDFGLLPDGIPDLNQAHNFFEFARSIYLKIGEELEMKK